VPPSETLPPARVRVETAEIKSRQAVEETVGTVRAKLHAAIEAKTSGRIEKMLAQPGQAVKAGELLVQLDARETQARLDQAAALREQYARDTERLRTLLADKTVSRQEFEAVEARYRVAVAYSAEAETLLGYTRIVAPFDGIITRKAADVGDLAVPGRALLEMDDPRAFRIEADLPEALIQRVQLGQKLSVRAGAQDAPVEGAVSEISPVADPASRTFNIKLDLPPNSGLRAGQFARVSVPVAQSKALRLPASAVVQRGQMEVVFVSTNSRAQLRLVKTGRQVGEEIELVSGVNPGERVVIEGANSLRDGQPLEVRP